MGGGNRLRARSRSQAHAERNRNQRDYGLLHMIPPNSRACPHRPGYALVTNNVGSPHLASNSLVGAAATISLAPYPSFIMPARRVRTAFNMSACAWTSALV